ncbi:electron transfer flavoprotein subunit beta/FixA family protein [Thermoanaerobacter thermohydrosulfuricus]|jgi:electron transfer flavoprotein beta subunit|uniref:Electron transfer flavoprotein small subunit n=1 Tax=Thermoanaerobacter thermohydrosulfuricus WC1 TaxID=1198630 RepID=M8DG22_THETY|nr:MULTISPECIES: electron transfer flavoprotein subunit beta/FixA family protein [Thermoanaerobacter]EMT38987.1 Electron transfer flavoprotein, beta subunit [Thermoanaerobacter thermohydrosulfuricus WC1]SFE18148.1 electron transfer flavoprotein beta subunit [Thermoanaerobacter thermohydrosulfuricus]HHY80011.1 electron transfer flavoprotein subunit beta/FixA family protein [Thermoanaerobacter sp.]
MNILVFIKQVPDTNEVKIDPVTKTLIREGVPSIINPDDKNALEEAIRIKEEYGAKVIVITMGPPQAETALREALAMGADEAYLLTDRVFAGADTYATAKTLSKMAKKFDYDIIFCGRQAIDGDTAQVGPQLAEQLNIPQVTYVKEVEIEGDTLIVKRALEDGYEVIKVKMPVLLTAIKELNTPRYPSIKGIFEAYREKEVKIVTAADLGVDPQEVGLKGSPTKVISTTTPETQRAGEIFTGNVKECVQNLVQRLVEKHVI